MRDGGWELGSDGWSPRRTVQDRMTGHDVRLTDEQVALVQRLQRGQFGDASFDPYEVGGCGWPRGRDTAGTWPQPVLVSPAGCGLLQWGPHDPPCDQPPRRQAQLHPVPGGEGKGGCPPPGSATLPALPCPALTTSVCRCRAWCTRSRWAGSSLAGPVTLPPASMTCGLRRTPMSCWDVTRCMCLRPSWPCQAMLSPTTRPPSTCPARRRWVWLRWGLCPGPWPQLTPLSVSTEPGLGAAGAQ